ncbi:cupin domain-containing protein [Allorhizobium sp. BGMRC 0089]|nr:cupin domain-containing protein [Allorhizobium sonneratiae]
MNIDEVELVASSAGNVFADRCGSLSDVIGARQLGYNLTVVAPGKRSSPFHNHHANEEMFFILEGEGTYRYGDAYFSVRPGDVMAAPAGGRETAHHIINTGRHDLKYLSVSTKRTPDVCEYPESDKFQILSSTEENTNQFRYIGRMASSLDYFDGEI